MPYKSDAQRRKFHALLNDGKIAKKTVDEYDVASAGMKLPERAPKRKQSLIARVRQPRRTAK